MSELLAALGVSPLVALVLVAVAIVVVLLLWRMFVDLIVGVITLLATLVIIFRKLAPLGPELSRMSRIAIGIMSLTAGILLVCTFAAAIWVAFFQSGHEAGPSISQRYAAGPWLEPSPDVLGALARNRVRDCGEVYEKPAFGEIRKDSEYLVYCTLEEPNDWVGYLVWPGINKVVSTPVDIAVPPPDLKVFVPSRACLSAIRASDILRFCRPTR